MTVSSIQLFNIIKERIGEREAQAMVEYIETKVETEVHEKADTLATKVDIGLVKTDIAELRTEIAESKSELLRWMFIFWSSSIVTLAGIIIAILRFFPGK